MDTWTSAVNRNGLGHTVMYGHTRYFQIQWFTKPSWPGGGSYYFHFTVQAQPVFPVS